MKGNLHRRISLLLVPSCFTALWCFGLPAGAQVSFASSITLALRNSPRVQSAQDDLRRARAELSVSEDIFIPSVGASFGAGYSYGITLTVPTIFTLNAQSLVYSPSQRHYIRASKLDVEAALFSLAETREQVEEDTALTYLSLDRLQHTTPALKEEYAFAAKLVSIAEDRQNAGLEDELDLARSRRVAVQIKLDELEAEDQIAVLREHLGDLIGIQGTQLTTVPDSIPSPPSADAVVSSSEIRYQDTNEVLSAQASARAKQEKAEGDSRYTWKPQVTFNAQYGRVSPINNVTEFYDLHGNYNSAFAGVQVQLPFLDRVRTSAAKESIADAAHGVHQLAILQDEQHENQIKLQRSIAELATKAELAEIDEHIAQGELKGVLLNLESGTGPRATTPEDEQNARIKERQLYISSVNARLEVFKAEISLLRQTQQLGTWLHSLMQASYPPSASTPASPR